MSLLTLFQSAGVPEGTFPVPAGNLTLTGYAPTVDVSETPAVVEKAIPPPRFRRFYEHVATGGFRLGGSAPYSRARVFQTGGGFGLTSSAVVAVSRDVAPTSGGINVGGWAAAEFFDNAIAAEDEELLALLEV